jgi:hypothetical protein
MVRRYRHRAAKRVDLLDQVALADATDRWIAGHLAQSFEIMRQQQDLASDPSRSKRGLGPRVTAANDDYIKYFRELSHFSTYCQD